MLKRISDFLKPKTDNANNAVNAEEEPIISNVDNLEAPLTESRQAEISLDEMIDTVSDQFDTEDDNYDIQELLDMDQDAGYIEHSPETVGYSTREQQFAAYRIIANVIEAGSSILDVGCGRGDFKVFYAQEMQLDYNSINYAGIDINPILINAGKNIYTEIELYENDWMDIPDNLKKDWVVNINSLNLRYDASSTDNWEYFTKTVTSMYEHANRGVAIMLASDISETNEGLVNWSPGEVLNWCQKTFGVVAVDHTYSEDMFTLIIYK